MYQIGDVTHYTCTETAKFVRQALKDAFPGVKFSVRVDSNARSAGLKIEYLASCTEEEVSKVVEAFRGSYWDSEYEMMRDRYTTRDGKKVCYGMSYLHVTRKVVETSAVAVNPLQIAKKVSE